MPLTSFQLRSLETDPTTLQHQATVTIDYQRAHLTLRVTDPTFNDIYLAEVTIQIAGNELGVIVKDTFHPDDGDEFLLHDYLGEPVEP